MLFSIDSRATLHVEKKVAHGNPRVSHDMVCSIHGVSMGLTAHGLLFSLMTSVDIDIFVFSIIYCIGENNCMGITWRTMGL